MGGVTTVYNEKIISKVSIRLSFQCQNSEYARVLYVLGFWICQSSEYTSGSQYVRVLNMPDFAWVCMNMPKSV